VHLCKNYYEDNAVNVILHPRGYRFISLDDGREPELREMIEGREPQASEAISLHPRLAELLSGRIPQSQIHYDLTRSKAKRVAEIDVPWWLALALWWLGFTRN